MNDGASVGPPLAGVRVLDFTHVIAGPYCTMMLADMGADVVKVERPQGDDLRRVGRYAGRGPQDEDYFYTVNRRKRSVVLDLSDEGGREVALRLADRADVVVFNYAPGTAERLGLGPEVLRERNARLIYCAISGFGQTGPLRDRLALDSIVQAFSGIMSVTGEPGEPPMSVGAPIADVISGMFAAFTIVATLPEARRTGRGAFLDVSMLESMLAVLGPRMGEALQTGRQPDRVGNENPMRVPAGMFAGRDGKYITVISHDQAQWPRFCAAIGKPEWIEDPRYTTMPDRVGHRDELHRDIAEIIAQDDAQHWLDRFTQARVPSAPVYDYPEALANEHVRERGLVLDVEHPASGPIRLVGPPWSSTLPQPPLTPPPLLGADTANVLDDWLDDVRDRQVVRGANR